MDDMFWYLILFALFLGGMIAFLAWLQRREQTEEKKDGFLFRHKCPRCKQRIGYRKHQIGKKAMCPNCFYPIVFPGEAAPENPPAAPQV